MKKLPGRRHPRWRKPLNLLEAVEVLRRHTGLDRHRLFCRRRGGRCEVILLKEIGRYEVYSATSWRKAIQAAGIYWESDYD